MDHDFDTAKYNAYRKQTGFSKFIYRKYNGASCAKGFMSYQYQGKIGWSACSARDFSRFLTKGGTTNPCLNYKTLNKATKSTTSTTTTTSTSGKACTAACAKKFK